MSDVTWDTDVFMAPARRVIRQRMADLLPLITSKVERDQFIEDEAESLAYVLAETAAERIADMRAEATL